MEAWLTTAKAGPRQRRWVAEGVMFNVYIIKSEKLNTYYVGYTSDLEKESVTIITGKINLQKMVFLGNWHTVR